MCLFGEAEDGGRALTHLGDATGRRFDVFRRNGLYGIDDDSIGTGIFDMNINLFQRSFANDKAIAGCTCQAVGA